MDESAQQQQKKREGEHQRQLGLPNWKKKVGGIILLFRTVPRNKRAVVYVGRTSMRFTRQGFRSALSFALWKNAAIAM